MGIKRPYYINIWWNYFSKVLKWLLENINTVCTFFTSKQYPDALTQEWWLVSIVIQHLLLAVDITFRSLQTDWGVVSNQYYNLIRLLLKLQDHCYAERDKSHDISAPLEFTGNSVSVFQFKVTSSGM